MTNSKINLFCLPFAGASKSSYKVFEKYVGDHVSIVPIEIPGRGYRFKEKLLFDIESLVEDIYSQIKDKLTSPYAFYGHSMGAILAYLLTRKIIKENQPQPYYLFCSGRGGPSIGCKNIYYLLPKEEFKELMIELGGLPNEILEDEALMNFYESIIKADFQAMDTYVYKQEAPLNIPIDVMIGDNDKATYEEALTWQKESTMNVEVKVFPGRHFFIFDHKAEIMSLISSALEKVTEVKSN